MDFHHFKFILAIVIIVTIVLCWYISYSLEKYDQEKTYEKSDIFRETRLRTYSNGKKEIFVPFRKYFFGFMQKNKLERINDTFQQNEIITFFRDQSERSSDAYVILCSSGEWKVDGFRLYEKRFSVEPLTIRNTMNTQNVTIIQYGNGMINLSISQNDLSCISSLAHNSNSLSQDDRFFLENLVKKLSNNSVLDSSELARFSTILEYAQKYEPAFSLANNLIELCSAISKFLNL
ncbi:hypothetical protein [Neisseria sp. 74A18]|uniref:hypothetical protein n=1 Tax=Neisseria sp. 74A18 TaxID=1696094 RepID=UPI0012E1EF16|nr:hypothetical protein [Neisseria sp. 74A18]